MEQVMCYCCEMWEPVDPIEGHGDYICSKCLLLEEIQLHIDELQSELQTLRHIREGDSYLDSVYQEIATPNRLTNVDCSQAQDGVAMSEASRGIQEVGLEEMQALLLSNRFEALTPCEGRSRDCGEDEQPAHSTMEWGAIPEGGVNRNVVVIGDSIVRGIDRVLCNRERESRRLCCQPGARVKDISSGLERNLQWEGEDPVGLIHIGTNDIDRTRKKVLLQEYEQLGVKLKNRTSGVIISGLLPEPRANLARLNKIRELNAWLKDWCGRSGFCFLGHWHQYWDRRELFRRDGLHLNQAGISVLVNHITRAAERSLN
ncbi:uncharacterized protein [Hemitrygon akajei]|uniref:uncharacterized protein n=1 Tax=Hemitrygon akajei TaxID=2704970 RepID=UPI003BF9E2EE